jgi:beta-glucosidase
LRGFERVHLERGRTEHVHFSLTPRDLSIVNEAGDRLVPEGEYAITVGGGQPGTGAPVTAAAFRVDGEEKLPE